MERVPGEDDMDEFNLSEFDEDFAAAPIEPKKDFDAVPDGKYQVNVERVELTKAKTGTRLLKWTLKIISGKYAGRYLWRNNVMATRENMRWLKGDLHTCGLDLERASDLQANLEKLLDVKLQVTKRSKGENVNVYLDKRIVVGDEPARGGYGARDDDLSF